MANLICKDVVKSYKDKTVLNNINLVIEPNKIYGLLGRNGVGKTTLLGILSAQNTCNSGTVTYGGEPVWENQKILNNICFSRELQVYSIKNEKIRAYLKRASLYYPYWDSDYANKLIEEFKLNTKLNFYQLSKGMLSMITIIIALASNSLITILDEPISGLDIPMREKFYNLLLEDYIQTQRTFIISTHIFEEISNIFEEVIILNNKNILLKQNTQQLINSCYYISGHIDIINKLSELNIIHSETIGRQKNICVMLNQNQNIEQITKHIDVVVSSVSLQKLFVYLTDEIKEEI